MLGLAMQAALMRSPLMEENPEEETLPLRSRPPPKPGKISFNIKGAREAIAAAQAQAQAEEAVKNARERRLNTRDASTQTVQDPERQDGGIVTIWRLRPRGMESFPHFPRAAKRKMREAVLCAAAADEEDAMEALGRKRAATHSRRRDRHVVAAAVGLVLDATTGPTTVAIDLDEVPAAPPESAAPEATT